MVHSITGACSHTGPAGGRWGQRTRGGTRAEPRGSSTGSRRKDSCQWAHTELKGGTWDRGTGGRKSRAGGWVAEWEEAKSS